jgi:hypothetical protein
MISQLHHSHVVFCSVLLLSFFRSCGNPNGNIVPRGVAAFYTSDDKLLHAIVLQTNGDMTEVYWTDPSKASRVPLAQTKITDVVGVGGYYSSHDKMRHALIAEASGAIWDFPYNSATPGALRQIKPSTTIIGHIQAIDGYATSDGEQHIIIGTDQKMVFQLRYAEDDSTHVEALLIGPAYNDGAFNGVAGSEVSGGKEQVVAVTDNNVYTSQFSGTNSPSVQQCVPDSHCDTKELCRTGFTFGESPAPGQSAISYTTFQARPFGTSGNTGIIAQVPAKKTQSAYDVFLQSGLNCLEDSYSVQLPPVWQTGPKVVVALGTLTDSKGIQHGIVGTIAGVLIDIPIPTTPNTSANPVNMTTFTP